MPGSIQVGIPMQFSEYAKQRIIIRTKDRVYGKSYKYDIKRNRFIEESDYEDVGKIIRIG